MQEAMAPQEEMDAVAVAVAVAVAGNEMEEMTWVEVAAVAAVELLEGRKEWEEPVEAHHSPFSCITMVLVVL